MIKSFEEHKRGDLIEQVNELLVHYKHADHDDLYLAKARHTKKLVEKAQLSLPDNGSNNQA